jgi:methionyl-tRNA formyltransferase
MTEERILFLGPADSPTLVWLREQGERVVQTSEKITDDFINAGRFTFLICYGYRYILRKEILDRFSGRAINLHISYLPWNRGADPNFWSFVEDTPKGVTIHYLDEGVDTGDMLVQREVEFASDSDTLATSYEKLQAAIQCLFRQNWGKIKNGNCRRQRQVGKGSFHRVKDKKRLSHLLRDGWNTPVSVLEEYAAETENS